LQPSVTDYFTQPPLRLLLQQYQPVWSLCSGDQGPDLQKIL